MNPRISSALALPALATLALAALPARTAHAALPDEDGARDLRLDLVLTSPSVIEPGADVLITATLVNTSATRTTYVVKPGDGSEMGWREPWVYYSATRIAPDGVAHDVPAEMMRRCGLFDPEWVNDIVALAPGGRLDLHTWIPDPSRALALDELGQIELRMHYAFRGGRADRFAAPNGKPHPLANAKAFEVVSAPVRLTIESALALRATLRPDAPRLRVGQPVRLAELLALAIVNTSSAPVTVHAPGTPYTFAFETCPGSFERGQPLRGLRAFVTEIDLPTPVATPESATLGPGESLPLLGPGARFSAPGHADGRWIPSAPGPFTVQVVYYEPELGKTKRKLVSAPLTFDVAP